MKKLLVLVIALVGCTVYIYSNTQTAKEEQQYIVDGYTEHESGAELIIGGEVEKHHNDTKAVVQMQNDYISYYNDQITFDEVVARNIKNFEKVSHYPFLAMKGNLFSVGYFTNSAVQVYYQSSIDETRTVIYKVTHNKDKNSVEIIYDGDYLITVAVKATDEDISVLHLYDRDSEETLLEVE